MSRLSTALNNDFTALCFLRDELALQVSLLEADMKDRWNALEQKLQTLREHLGRAEVVAGKTRRDLQSSARTMMASLRTGYEDVRKALKN